VARTRPRPIIELAPGAENNGFATMLAELVRQNLDAKPHKAKDFDAIHANIAIVAEDAEVALTLAFDGGRLLVHDGIFNVPDVTVRGSSDIIMALSNLPLTTPLALPFPRRGDREARATMGSVISAMRDGSFKVYGMALHMGAMMHLTRGMSVNG
jgi:hypothetical protein